MAEFSATIKDLKDARVVITITFPFYLSYLACAEDKWILENDSGLLSASPCDDSNCIFCIRSGFIAWANTSTGTSYAAIDLANSHFPILVHKIPRTVCFSWQGQWYTFIVLLQEYSYSPALCDNFVCRDLDHLSLPQDNRPVHYIDDIMLIGISKQEFTIVPDLLFRWGLEQGKALQAGPGCCVSCSATRAIWSGRPNGAGNISGRKGCSLDLLAGPYR